MIELTKNQKIFFGGLAVLVVAVICYYIMTKSTLVDYSEIEQPINIIQEQITAPKEIVIHITGAVLNEGIVKLEEGSRISDVIEAARRSTCKCRFFKNKFSLCCIRWAKNIYPQYI